jgi:hypothetical protein
MATHPVAPSFQIFEDAVAICTKIRDASWFNGIITVTIILVGLVIGTNTDHFLRW